MRSVLLLSCLALLACTESLPAYETPDAGAGPVDLAAGSTMGNQPLATRAELPSADQVRADVTSRPIALAAGSTMGIAPLATMADLPTAEQIRGTVTSQAVDLAGGSTVSGKALATTDQIPSPLQIRSDVAAQSIDLAPGSTISGLPIATRDEIPSPSIIRGDVTSQSIDLAASSTLAGKPLATTDAIPSADQIRADVTSQAVDLAPGSTMGSKALATTDAIPSADQIRGDVSTQAIDLAAGTTVAGAALQAQIGGICSAGSAIGAVFSDGGVSCNSSLPSNVITVGPSGAMFTSLSAAIAAISGEVSATHPFLIQLAPGTYQEAADVTVPEGVTIAGAGTLSTTLNAVLYLHDDEVRDLTISSAQTYGPGLCANGNGTHRISNVVSHSTIALNTGKTELDRVEVDSIAGTTAISLGGSAVVVIRDSKVIATGASVSGIAGTGNGLEIWNSEVLALDGGSDALYPYDDKPVIVRNSHLSGGTWAFHGNGNPTFVSNELEGTVQVSGGVPTCTATTLADGGFLPTGCP